MICDDPDAPTGEPWVHWVIYKIPAEATGLPEGLPREKTLKTPAGAVQGVNSFSKDNLGYRGPMPPPGHGTHHYHFKIYALDKPVPCRRASTRRRSWPRSATTCWPRANWSERIRGEVSEVKRARPAQASRPASRRPPALRSGRRAGAANGGRGTCLALDPRLSARVERQTSIAAAGGRGSSCPRGRQPWR